MKIFRISNSTMKFGDISGIGNSKIVHLVAYLYSPQTQLSHLKNRHINITRTDVDLQYNLLIFDILIIDIYSKCPKGHTHLATLV